ncbi:Spiroplasmavirus-related protein [Spiroplasma kunkelii CR2-3x]|uniref:Spiroplasmavirus-related protein n=1 Tax=Spiroplasma kunkelii CR2-3x TaxID=273035 RepID=A0A0K2JIK2_SPIKU|nr:lipoprotein [Spiroplasma kunkelii]ALA98424.1 Spiroplasmavirus-related protein [Spiroplasma kunkelii CR2-3x]
MKKWLSIIGAIELTATSTITLISCNKENNNKNKEDNKPELPDNQQQPPEGSNWKQVIAQEKPFNKVDNKYYFVVWRGDKNDDWKIIKFNNNEKIKRWHPKTLDVQNNIKLCLTNYAEIPIDIDLSIDASTINRWKDDIKNNYFKAVYRWDGVGEPQLPTINKNTSEIIDWKEQKGTE